MEWKNPICKMCKKEIGKPAEAVYAAYSLQGDCYSHATCFAKNLAAYAGDASTFGGYARGTFSDIADETRSGDQNRLQRRASLNFSYGIFGGLVFFGAGAAAFLGNKTDVIVFLASAVLLLLGFFLLAANLMAMVRVRQFEALVKNSASTKG